MSDPEAAEEAKDLQEAIDAVEHLEPAVDKYFPELRKKYAPQLKILTTSIGDVVGDWLYYFHILNYSGTVDLTDYKIPLLICCIFSTVMALALVVTYALKTLGKHSKCTKHTKKILLAEMILADVPQFILTGLIEMEKKGGLSSSGVFNLTTSAYNVVHNVIELFDPVNDEKGKEK